MAVRDVVQAAAGVGGGGEYVEDVFSTYLWNGTNGQAGPFVTGVDLLNEGGLLWTKSRTNAYDHYLLDTVRGNGSILTTNNTAAAAISPGAVNFYSDGFKDNFSYMIGTSQVSWTFRKAPKFFSVVTYTGDGTSSRQIVHDLGSTPGFIAIKRTDTNSDWVTSFYAGETFIGRARLNSTDAFNGAAATNNGYIAAPHNADTFGTEAYGSNVSAVNATGGSYVAYLFASNAGGFGDDGEQNVISCGSYTADSSNNYHVDVGFEPQWVMIKRTSGTGDWEMLDVMRGFTADASGGQFLEANNSNAEFNDYGAYLTSTGFVGSNQSGANGASYIYIAIRRPMKTPESGTEVFAPVAYAGSGSTRILDASIVPDIYMGNTRTPAGGPVGMFVDRMRGNSKYIRTYDTAVEGGVSPSRDFYQQTQFTLTDTADNVSGRTYVSWFMRRAPGFMDVVAYTGTGVAHAEAHNLGVVPELIIAKRRSGAIAHWPVYSKSLNGGVNPAMYYLYLSISDGTSESPTAWNDTAPTSSVFTVGTAGNINASGAPYVAYLFSSLPGVSKVGSYTGTGADLNVDCGFSAGARFILIKRTDNNGDWYVWDSLRGITAGNDPYLLLNSTAAEVTSTDYIDPLASGFTVTSSAPAALNASGGSYIFLAIA